MVRLLAALQQISWPSLCIACAIAAATLSGCGPSEPFSMVPVSGKVTYEDGSLIEAERISVTFVSQTPPLDKKTFPRPAQASVNVADGTFDSVLHPSGADGIVAGKHKIKIQAFGPNDVPSPAVPEEYTDPATTPILVDSSESPFHFKIKKPSP